MNINLVLKSKTKIIKMIIKIIKIFIFKKTIEIYKSINNK